MINAKTISSILFSFHHKNLKRKYSKAEDRTLNLHFTSIISRAMQGSAISFYTHRQYRSFVRGDPSRLYTNQFSVEKKLYLLRNWSIY